jgi:methyl-accepting chemotaxis protein
LPDHLSPGLRELRTKDDINEASHKVKDIITVIEASVEQIETGSRYMHDTGHSMEEIQSAVNRVKGIIDEISLSASEQARGIGQIADAVDHLGQMTQPNAALVEQGASAAESLREQSSRMDDVVQTFRLAQ